MDTKKKSIRKSDIKDSDKGILISDLYKILSSTDNTSEELLKKLELDFDKKEFIPIVGAQTLVNHLSAINKTHIKKDLISNVKDIRFNYGESFSFIFHNISDSENYFGDKSIIAIPKYSSQREFFSNLYSMDRYADKLIKNELQKILDINLELLQKEETKDRKYRLVYYKPEEKYYLRAIVSTDNYFDYNNSIAVVIALLTLFTEMKNSGTEYSLKLCEYNESNIRMFFDTHETRELSGIGKVRNLIEISNDEIKREALKFSGICSISYSDKNDNAELFIKPKDIKSKILTIKHNQKPENALKSLLDFENVEDVHNDLYEDIKTIQKIKNPEQIKFLVRRKIENAKNDAIQNYKSKIINELSNSTTKNIIDLIQLFDKIHVFADEDIEATEYLRFVIFEALINRK